MSAPVRKLRWRIMRGARWLDLVEERADGNSAYVGLIDGREQVRASDGRMVGVALIKAAVQLNEGAAWRSLTCGGLCR